MGAVMTDTKAADPENTLYMDLKDGRVVIELRPDLAPKHVERIKTLARQGFYDGTPFHRVIDGFMVQGGDPTGTGRGGSELPDLPAEFSPPSKARHVEGICSMARTADPNSANSQFFIMLAPSTHLDGQYTIWGKVVQGMDFVHMIKKGDSRANGAVEDPDRIVKLSVAADVDK
jgi:peptidylprolyl isomerase